MKKFLFYAVTLAVFLSCNSARAQGVELTDDVSRQELFRYAMRFQPNTRSIPQRFMLPDGANAKPAWVFGIDVSHYDGKINWALVPQHGVSFVYVKATQGENGYDGTFKSHWAALAQPGAKLYRGAYHFLSADGDPAKQAQNFISVVHPVATGDMPPCLDLEWDMARGSTKDRFAKYSAKQIVQKAQTWLKAVQQAGGGRRPIIYTNASFWKQRGLDKEAGLAGYKIWIADYSSGSLQKENPKVPTSFKAPIWQFSEKGRFSQGGIIDADVDISTFKGSRAAFAKEFALTQ